MKIKNLGIVIAAFAIANSPLVAHSQGYLGSQYSLINFEVSGDGVSADWEPTSLIFRGGVHATDYVQLEARLGFGLSDDDNVGISVEVDQIVGVYGKVSLPNQLSPYVIFGFSNIDLEIDGVSDDDDDFSYGIGLDFYVSERSAVNVEYMSYYDDSDDGVDVEITAIGIGFTYKF